MVVGLEVLFCDGMVDVFEDVGLWVFGLSKMVV